MTTIPSPQQYMRQQRLLNGGTYLKTTTTVILFMDDERRLVLSVSTRRESYSTIDGTEPLCSSTITRSAHFTIPRIKVGGQQ